MVHAKRMHGAGGEENRPGNERTTAMFEGLLASRSVLPLLQLFPPILFWRSSSELHLCNLRSSLFLLVFCTFFFPVLQILYAKNESKDRKAVPAGLWFLFFFSFFLRFLHFFFVSFSVFSFSPSLVTEMDKDNGTAASAHSRWSLLLGTVKTLATLVDDLYSFSFLLLMLSVEMMRETTMKTCYAGWVHAPASVFFLLLTVAFCFPFSFVPLLSFSVWLHISLFFCNFVPVKTFTVEKMNPCSLRFSLLFRSTAEASI